jgi:hypothetical protein
VSVVGVVVVVDAGLFGDEWVGPWLVAGGPECGPPPLPPPGLPRAGAAATRAAAPASIAIDDFNISKLLNLLGIWASINVRQDRRVRVYDKLPFGVGRSTNEKGPPRQDGPVSVFDEVRRS